MLADCQCALTLDDVSGLLLMHLSVMESTMPRDSEHKIAPESGTGRGRKGKRGGRTWMSLC